jgi:hypothetical protein
VVIVLIHWRIKPNRDSEAAFFDYWATKAKIGDKLNLVGEFLSTPIPARDFPYRVDDLSFGPGVLDCWHYLNVGFWKDKESFHDQVGKHMKDDKDIEHFEVDRQPSHQNRP